MFNTIMGLWTAMMVIAVVCGVIGLVTDNKGLFWGSFWWLVFNALAVVITGLTWIWLESS